MPDDKMLKLKKYRKQNQKQYQKEYRKRIKEHDNFDKTAVLNP